MKNVIWFQYINKIGGVESVIWNVIRKYDSDITIWYNSGDSYQLYRFSHYAKLHKFNPNETIECENLFINYGYEMIEGHFKAKNIYYIIHANYQYMKLTPVTDKSFHYLAVSNYAGEKYEEISGIKPDFFPNTITIDDFRQPFILMSATRVEKDKGKIKERMEKFAKRLDDWNIPFLWFVFTNGKMEAKNKSIIRVDSRLDIIPFMRKADFVVQLSDTEAFCMTALETLSVCTPMIATKIPSFYEEKMNDDNTIFLDFDLSNVDDAIAKMLTKKFDFTYTPVEDKWGELLLNSKRGDLHPMKRYKVKATNEVLRGGGISIEEFGGTPQPGDIAYVIEDRIPTLQGKNIYGAKFVEIIEEDTSLYQEQNEIKVPDDAVLVEESIKLEPKKRVSKAVKKPLRKEQ